MSLEELTKENLILKEQIKELKDKLQQSEDNIKRYTNSDAHKKYYLEHKDEVKTKGKEYLQKLKEEDPEKLKKYRHTAYVNRKKKNENLINIEIN